MNPESVIRKVRDLHALFVARFRGALEPRAFDRLDRAPADAGE
jgi:hypothetical protein